MRTIISCPNKKYNNQIITNKIVTVMTIMKSYYSEEKKKNNQEAKYKIYLRILVDGY